MGNSPTLSVIIPAYNEAAFIGPCLDAIAQQTQKPDEVIVVDNNSRDDTAAIAKTYPFVRLLHEPEQGMIPARNKGLDNAYGKLLARIDADTRLPHRWVETVHELCDHRVHDIFGISGPHYLYDLSSSSLLRKLETQVISRYGYFGLSRLMLRQETLFGSNMVITRRAWKAIRRHVCSDSVSVHEDVDLAIHLGEIGTVDYSDTMIVGISDRPFHEPITKMLWRLKTWDRTIRTHRGYFVPASKPSGLL